MRSERLELSINGLKGHCSMNANASIWTRTSVRQTTRSELKSACNRNSYLRQYVPRLPASINELRN